MSLGAEDLPNRHIEIANMCAYYKVEKILQLLSFPRTPKKLLR